MTAFCEKPLFLSELRKVLAEPVRVQQEQTPALPTKVDFSGKHLLLVEDNALNAGMNGHIAKPLDIPHLLKVLDEALQ